MPPSIDPVFHGDDVALGARMVRTRSGLVGGRIPPSPAALTGMELENSLTVAPD
jgi:hypothetical protein